MIEIVDERPKLTKQRCSEIFDKIDELATDKQTYWWEEPYEVFIGKLPMTGWKAKVAKLFPRLVAEFPFKIILSKDAESATIIVYCADAEVPTSAYDEDYLKRLGDLLERERFKVTAKLIVGEDEDA